MVSRGIRYRCFYQRERAETLQFGHLGNGRIGDLGSMKVERLKRRDLGQVFDADVGDSRSCEIQGTGVSALLWMQERQGFRR